MAVSERATGEPNPSRSDRALREAVALNVARLRRNAGLEIEELAAASGLSVEHLAALESSGATPGLRALWALAHVFEVPFGILLSGAACTTTDFHLLRSGGTPVVDSGSGFHTRPLTAAADPREPDVYEVTLAPGWVEVASSHAADTFEHIVVVRGTLGIEVAESGATLAVGDAVFFRADRPHTYRNPGVTESLLVLTMVYAGDWIATMD